MCAYLADFRNKPDNRTSNSKSFFKYLLSASWRKIYRRIESWRGLGLIYKLSAARTKFKVERYRHWDEVQYDVRGERYLVEIFTKYPNVIDGLKYATTTKGADNLGAPAEGFLRFDSLMAAILQKAPQLYTKQTAEDFHTFIYASFVTFGRALRRFSRATGVKKKETSTDQLIEIFNALRGQVELLLFIVTSSTFKQHIEVFCDIDGLGILDLVPDFSERETYEKFGSGMMISDRKMGGKKDDGGEVTSVPGGDRTGKTTLRPSSIDTDKATPGSGAIWKNEAGPGLAPASDDTSDSNMDGGRCELEVRRAI